MVKSKIERKKKILDERKKTEENLMKKRKRIADSGDTDDIKEVKINRPDELIGLIIFILIPNIFIPFISFVYSLITLIFLLLANDPLFFWYLYSIIMYLSISAITGLTSYWLYQLKKFSYFLALGICLFNLTINISLLFSLNILIIIIALIILILNGIDVYFLLAYKEIRDALNIPS
ncbi:MAG: hypothetical protein EAX96_19470 [Candidatus Lokiarchaeota archaeon]|nr:hypothetical protein [Candidatus Lokiarchaeota archaeon]